MENKSDQKIKVAENNNLPTLPSESWHKIFSYVPTLSLLPLKVLNSFFQELINYKIDNLNSEQRKELNYLKRERQERKYKIDDLQEEMKRHEEFEEFKSNYKQEYKSKLLRNPFSPMNFGLWFGNINSIERVKEYANENPKSRSANILKRK